MTTRKWIHVVPCFFVWACVGGMPPDPESCNLPADGGVAPISDAGLRPNLQPLGFLLGDWQGSGWMMLGPNQKADFNETETVRSRLEGAIVTVEGVGRAADAGQGTVHHAYAVIAYDAAAQRFRFSSYLADGRFLDADATAVDGGLTWGYDDPQAGTVRYVIGLDERGRWHETGEASRSGSPWFPFFEMTLTRQ